MRIRNILALLALGGVALTACGGDSGGGPSPQAGLLTVTLTTAASTPGAILFTVSGGQIDAVTASGYTTYQTVLGNNSRRVMVTGNITAGTLVQIQVPDVSKASSYVASVQQVSARGSAAAPYAQQPTGGFTLAVGQ